MRRRTKMVMGALVRPSSSLLPSTSSSSSSSTSSTLFSNGVTAIQFVFLLVLLLISISTNSTASFVISVNSKFAGLGSSLSDLKSHDDLRHLHILAAGVDLPLGGIGRPDAVGWVVYSLSFAFMIHMNMYLYIVMIMLQAVFIESIVTVGFWYINWVHWNF